MLFISINYPLCFMLIYFSIYISVFFSFIYLLIYIFILFYFQTSFVIKIYVFHLSDSILDFLRIIQIHILSFN